MRCIGLTGKQTKRLFLLQGGYLAATSVLASFILGLGVLGVVYGILHAAGQSFVIHITWVPFVLTAVIVFTVILVAFLIRNLLEALCFVGQSHRKIPQNAKYALHHSDSRLYLTLAIGDFYSCVYSKSFLWDDHIFQSKYRL